MIPEIGKLFVNFIIKTSIIWEFQDVKKHMANFDKFSCVLAIAIQTTSVVSNFEVSK